MCMERPSFFGGAWFATTGALVVARIICFILFYHQECSIKPSTTVSQSGNDGRSAVIRCLHRELLMLGNVIAFGVFLSFVKNEFHLNVNLLWRESRECVIGPAVHRAG